MTIAEIHKLFLESEGISTDTRNLIPNTIFFALKGDNFNGNEFAEKAIEGGCSYSIIDEAAYNTHPQTILVDSVLQTLQDLANYHRKQFDIPVLGITGSNGKTTTKELIGAVLSKKFNLLITEGNLNNHLGVPFTLLRMNNQHDFAVIEMGANKPGDIKELVEIAEPTHGLITNIGAAHIEGFGSLDGVIKTKTEMYDFIDRNGGVVFYNAEDEILAQHLPDVNEIVSYGERAGSIQGELLKLDPFVNFKWKSAATESPAITTNLVGKYNFINFLCAVCIGNYFKVPAVDMNAAIAEYVPSNNRSQVQKTERNTLVVDCYNANPTSMMAALKSFVQMEADSKVAILGDMLELGQISDEEHQKIADFLHANEIKAFLVGSEMGKVNSSLQKFENAQDLIDHSVLRDVTNAVVLLKGSRGIKLESLIAHL